MMALQDIDLIELGDRLGLNLTDVDLSGPDEALALSTDPLVGMFADEDNPLLVMSTGLAADVTAFNRAGDQGTDLGLEGGINDDIVLSFEFEKGDSDNFFSFDFTFLTEEFPEFIGAEFNDFFSAIVNGQEVALDLNGAVMDVNNAFFDPDLSTDGTQFDGRTATLRITTQLDVGQDVNTVELRIADEGDGRLDSAAFLGNFALSSHTVFVDFDAGVANFDTLFEDGLTFATSAADLTAEEINLILNGIDPAQGDVPDDDNILNDEAILGLRGIFDGFAIEFVTERPLFDDYSTIHVGGRFEDLPDILQSDEAVISLSEGIDLANVDDRDEAIVLSDEAIEVTTTAAKVGLIAQAIARETAHLVGLRNVEDRDAVVFPTPGESRTQLTATSPLAAVDENGALISFPVEQDIPNELGNNIGVAGPSIVPTTPLSETLTKVVTVELGATAPLLNEVRAVSVDADGNIIDIQRLDQLGPNDVVNLQIPVIEADRLVVIGKSEIGGDFDLFLSPDGVEDVSLLDTPQVEIFDAIGVSIDDLADGAFQISATVDATPLADPATVRTNVSEQEIVEGGDGDDSLEAGFLGGVLLGQDGDDTLDGDKGDDDLYGGAGADVILGGDGDDDLRGADGDDSLSGGDDNDILSGGAGADTVDGGAGADTIFAAAGDVVDGGAGLDVLRVEADFADQTLSEDDDGFIFTSADGILRVNDVERFEFSDQTLSEGDLDDILNPVIEEPDNGDPLTAGDDGEVIIGSSAPETVTGGAGEDSLDGGGGSDSLAGGVGADELFGNQGNDTLRGGAGADEMDGGAGRDKLVGGGDADTLNGGGGDDTLRGGADSDVLLGGFGSDALRGGGGGDDLNGGSGRDDARGGTGADLVRGGGGADNLNGGGGADIINGGRGADTLKGGGGKDIFQFKTGDGRDVIKDFRQGQDRIEILRGAEDFSDLNIDQVGVDVRITFSNVVIVVETDDKDNFTDADFIF